MLKVRNDTARSRVPQSEVVVESVCEKKEPGATGRGTPSLHAVAPHTRRMKTGRARGMERSSPRRGGWSVATGEAKPAYPPAERNPWKLPRDRPSHGFGDSMQSSDHNRSESDPSIDRATQCRADATDRCVSAGEPRHPLNQHQRSDRCVSQRLVFVGSALADGTFPTVKPIKIRVIPSAKADPTNSMLHHESSGMNIVMECLSVCGEPFM